MSETSMFATAIKLVGIGLIAIWLLAAHQVRASDILDREIPVFEVDNAPMLLAVSRLRELGVRVCFEEVEIDPHRDRVFNEKHEPVGVRKLAFSLRMQNKSVRAILDALVRADGEYTWKLDIESGVVNIFPTAGSVLNWTVDKLDAEGKGRLTVLQDDLNLKAHSMTLFWRGSYDYYNASLSLHIRNTPVVNLLNKISSVQPQLCWTLAGFKGGRILTVVPCMEVQ